MTIVDSVDRTFESKEVQRRELQQNTNILTISGEFSESIHHYLDGNIIEMGDVINYKEWSRDPQTGIPYLSKNGKYIIQEEHLRIPAFSIYKNPDWWNKICPTFIYPDDTVNPTLDAWKNRSQAQTRRDSSGINFYVDQQGRWIIDSFHCRIPVNKFYRISNPETWEVNHPHFINPGFDVSDDFLAFTKRSERMVDFHPLHGQKFYVDYFGKWVIDKFHRLVLLHPVRIRDYHNKTLESHPLWFNPTRSNVILATNYTPLASFNQTYFEEDVNDGVEYRKLNGKWILDKDNHREPRDLDPTTPILTAFIHAQKFKSGIKKGQVRRRDNPRRTGKLEEINPEMDEVRQKFLINKMCKTDDPFEQNVLFAKLVLGMGSANARRYALSVDSKELYYNVWRSGNASDVQKLWGSDKQSVKAELGYFSSHLIPSERILSRKESFTRMYDLAKEFGELAEIILIFYAIKSDVVKHLEFASDKIALVEGILKEIQQDLKNPNHLHYKKTKKEKVHHRNYLFEEKLEEYGYDIPKVRSVRRKLKKLYKKEFRI